ncbi:MAG: protein kinase, partial [Gemmataceae bacterium]|nr:protein kinase [Gemmataceae bacterium]
MALRIEAQFEILPGYRLLSKIGSGGYGEVWKCEAPGGLLKAVKIVYADLDSDGNQRTEQELNALRRVQAVRHPYLLSLERYDIVEGRLVIVTELADCNLWDRFTEYRQYRQPGIPRDDLLRYMYEAAEVLDLMNNQYQLQHLDIKPQNLFLVHDHIKVADFGLVRDLDGMKRATMTGGATPVYAAPETFEGIITPYCDQYSLAIVYQELLTGKRPFSATNLQQLIAQHLQAAPDLSPLPPNDRIAVAKALSKRPEDRHASCRDFVRGLMAGGDATETPGPAASHQPTSPIIVSSPEVNFNAAPWTGGETPTTQLLFRRDDTHLNGEAAPQRTAPPEEFGDGVLFPALVIGLGKTGVEVLRRVKRSISEQVGGIERVPNVRLLYIDTDPETLQQAIDDPDGNPLTADEIFAARLNRPAHYLKPRRNGRSLLEGWFDPQTLYRIKAGNPTTQGLRTLGRLAFCDHYRNLEHKLRADLEAVTHPSSLDTAEMQSQLTRRTNRPRVYIVACLAGATGGGMFIDLAYTVRAQLRLLGYDEPEVHGLFLLPAHQGPLARPQSLANTYAALTELNHFSLPGVNYSMNIDDRDATLVDSGSPFTRFFLLPLQSSRSTTAEAPGIGQVAEFVWRDLLTPFGRAADASRDEVMSLPGVRPTPQTVAGHTFGLYTVTWPRRQLADRVGRWLCVRVLEGWAATEDKHLRSSVEPWVREQWQAQHLGPETLMSQCQKACDMSLGMSAEKYLSDLAEPLLPRSRWSRSAYDSAVAFRALTAAVQLVGPAVDNGIQRPLGRLEQVLQSLTEAAVNEWSSRLKQLALCLIDQPGLRLAGAEIAVSTLQELCRSAIGHFETQLREKAAIAEQAYQATEAILAADTRRKRGPEIAENLTRFAAARYQWLLGRTVSTVYLRLHDLLTDVQKEIGLCRKRLFEMRDRLSPASTSTNSAGLLLPEGCHNLQEAVEMLRDAVESQALVELDRQMQALIEKQCNSLFQACLTATDFRIDLENALLQIARKRIYDQLGGVDVAELFLRRYGEPERAQRAVTRAFAHAEPWLDAPDAPNDMAELLAVPLRESCTRFLQLVAENLPGANPTIAESPDDIVFYRERVTVPL